MRTITNISLPATMQLQVRHAVRKGGYSTTSEFFRMLIRNWNEEQLLKELRQSQKDIRNGKGKKLKSVRDLMK